jgi:hypothetical protein
MRHSRIFRWCGTSKKPHAPTAVRSSSAYKYLYQKISSTDMIKEYVAMNSMVINRLTSCIDALVKKYSFSQRHEERKDNTCFICNFFATSAGFARLKTFCETITVYDINH